MTVLPSRGCLATYKKENPRQCSLASHQPWVMPVSLILILLIFLHMSTGTSSPQSLKKILSLSEEASDRHRRQPEDTVSNASSQLSSPPTSPQSSPKKGKLIISHTLWAPSLS